MKVSFENELLHQFSDLEIKSLCFRINKNTIPFAIKEKINFEIKKWCDEAFEELKSYWLPTIYKRYESIPTAKEKLVDLILAQEDYEDEYAKMMKRQMQNDSNFTIQ